MLKELASQGNEMYLLGDRNLFFDGQYVSKKSYAKLRGWGKPKTAKTLLRGMFSFWSNATNKQDLL